MGKEFGVGLVEPHLRLQFRKDCRKGELCIQQFFAKNDNVV
jgi:hypothetical protein